jgi:hypothetical protein
MNGTNAEHPNPTGTDTGNESTISDQEQVVQREGAGAAPSPTS